MQKPVNMVLGRFPHFTLMNDRFLPEIRIAIVCGVLAAGAFAGLLASTTPTEVAGTKVTLEDSDLARVERQFSQRPTNSGPAPRVWSSRLEIRWNARWESAPRYAV